MFSITRARSQATPILSRPFAQGTHPPILSNRFTQGHTEQALYYYYIFALLYYYYSYSSITLLFGSSRLCNFVSSSLAHSSMLPCATTHSLIRMHPRAATHAFIHPCPHAQPLTHSRARARRSLSKRRILAGSQSVTR